MKKLLNKGFTIVELVIVIAVIGILAAVLIPTFSNVIESANETADLQEAQSTLKAYTAYMTSNGKPLGDGAVFKIEETGRTFVFYKGELHKFEGKDTKLTKTPEVQIGKTPYACNKMFTSFIDEEPLNGGTDDKDKQMYLTFFYSDKKNVEFEDGSLKCKIYPGLVVKTYTPITPDTVNTELDDDTLWKELTLKVKFEITSVTGAKKSVKIGETVELTATVLAENGADLSVEYEIVPTDGQPDDCTINGNIFQAGATAGTVTVKVTSNQDASKSDTFEVTINAE